MIGATFRQPETPHSGRGELAVPGITPLERRSYKEIVCQPTESPFASAVKLEWA